MSASSQPAGTGASWDAERFHRPGYQPGIPATIEVPDSHLSELLETAARFYPDRVAIDFLGWTTTYRELLAASERAAQLLADAGVRAGDRVALIMPNCPQHVVAVYGALRLGAIVAEHNPLAPADQLRAQLDHHGARVVVAWEKAVDLVTDPAAEHDPSVDPLAGRTVFAVDLARALPAHLRAALRLPVAKARATRASMKAERLPAGVRSWDTEVARAPRLAASWPHPAGSDVAVLLHTGGTTGTPKAAMLTHTNLRANANQAIAWVPMLHEGGENFLALLPFFHAFGLTFNLFCAVQKAATQVMMPKFDVEAVLAAHKRRPLTFFVGVPVMFERILRAAQKAGTNLASLRYGVCGAAPMPPQVGAQWEELTGGYFVEGYGMTETSPIIAGTPMGPTRRLGALGLPFASTDVRVVDPDAPVIDPETEVPDGEPGELLVRGPQVFAGYWQDPEATAAAILPGGWLRTGDMVRREESFLWMADRRRELILSGGFNVYPSQVEAVLRQVPGVADIAVIGADNGSASETVVAAVVLDTDDSGEPTAEGRALSLEVLRSHGERLLPHYALPRRLEIIDEMPRSMIGKVLRREVRELLERRQHQA
ncbi:AMP-binding protein [Actinomyces urogenitalis]|uniref:AMP-binding protein n=1 Tax=Actinomyces urogenitalis TaxID=103621 RepID=UPI0028FF3DAC|nr:AMP-binding protein [Actinomyces urogenitalis]MDU0864527.1 AMP-binding protein [Actinomyces urogenitalis]MDU0875073.1 AMP-binding protein [Actinomyces urogenitalis]MDU1564530.1 AMP-binding protein [Actinomyces urogenitalis]MDU1640095.1 AMP-binding protein [Actinomyces urogenitalis]MDU6777822.1 AMP-binding protein [Actinomyces urogenitalis]